MRLVEDEEVVEAFATMDPMTRSTNGFCQGARGAVRISWIPCA